MILSVSLLISAVEPSHTAPVIKQSAINIISTEEGDTVIKKKKKKNSDYIRQCGKDQHENGAV